MSPGKAALASATAAYIHTPRIAENYDGQSSTVVARIELFGRPVDLWYRFHRIAPEAVADAVIPAVLLPAMMHGLPVVSESPVSERLQNKLSTIQDIYATWVPALRRVPIVAPVAPAAVEQGRETAAFFTGGIDSSYTLLSHRAEIGALIFVHGFATPLSGARRVEASRTLQRVAETFGMQRIEVESNLYLLLRDWLQVGSRGHLSPKMYNYELAHGAALASVAHLLPGSFGRVYIAASHTYNDLFPWGSHPLLDPLWSTERRDIVHDGAGATRVEKTRALAQSETVLQNLRVCPQGGTELAPNCGRCEKCVRTMVSLRIAGALDRCPAFAERLDLRRVSLLCAPDFKPFLRENLAAARALGSDPALVAALERAVHPWAPGRVALRLLLACWQLASRLLPLRYVDGRIRLRKHTAAPIR